MSQVLPEFKQHALECVESYIRITEKYSGSESIFEEGKASALATVAAETSRHCKEQIATCSPRVILFGIYNSGKSTLLNAMMGEERASVRDVPETDKLTPYIWNGYTLIDSPGIDAPLEHEQISKAEVGKCQVILFVVSTGGTFESKKIYDTMNEVVRQGKRLIIVLNDKEGCSVGSPQFVGIRRRIENIVEEHVETGSSISKRILQVNAKWALEARLNKDKDLVSDSGIEKLEKNIYEELRRIGGYGVVIDAMNFLKKQCKSLAGDLEAYSSSAGDQMTSRYLKMNESFATFRNGMSTDIEVICAPMAREIYRCFPNVDSSPAPDEESVREKIESITNKYTNLITNNLTGKIKIFQRDFVALCDGESAGFSESSLGDSIGAREDIVRQISQKLSSRPDEKKVETNFLPEKKPFSVLDVLDTVITPLPIPGKRLPLPFLPPIPIPPVVPVIMMGAKILVKFFKSAFGGEDKALRLSLEKQAEAERRAQEQHARDIANWKEELRNECEDMRTDFTASMKDHVLTYIDTAYESQFEAVRKAMQEHQHSCKEVTASIKDISNIVRNIDSLILRLNQTETKAEI